MCQRSQLQVMLFPEPWFLNQLKKNGGGVGRMYSKPQRDEKVLVQRLRVAVSWPPDSCCLGTVAAARAGTSPGCLSSRDSRACLGVLTSSACHPLWGNEFHTFIFAGYCAFLFIPRPTEVNTVLG